MSANFPVVPKLAFFALYSKRLVTQLSCEVNVIARTSRALIYSSFEKFCKPILLSLFEGRDVKSLVTTDCNSAVWFILKLGLIRVSRYI
jgi:hypothetical protein